jgi:hypothetical protein
MISTDRFTTGVKAAITNGRVTVTFGYPSDFADWLEKNPDENLALWQWVAPVAR